MASPENKVRVFISSTFRDMHAERDHLVTVVFPELRERCERLGLEFYDVDLRWGVPDKNVDGESANSWEYCRKWINEAKPFFICLLGQRYGWEPEPHQLKDESDQQAQAANRRSITDMEVHHALENDAHSRRCYFYIRQGQAPTTATEFVDPPPLLLKLDALKARVETCGRPVWHYPCCWTGSGFTDMEAFGKKVLEDLWSGILRDPRYVSREAWQLVLGTDPAKDPRFTDESHPVPEDIAEKLITLAKPPPKDSLKAEREEMQRFADSRLKWFQGREQELNELLQFIANPAEAHDLPRLAVIAAQPGQGKSALMAKLWHELQGRALGPPSAVPPGGALSPLSADSDARRVEDNASYLISHFVGATSQSSSSYHLVKRLNDELDASDITFPERPTPEGQPKEEPKLDFQSLCQRLWERLGDYAGERRIVILLDALNQLDDGHDLGWLPYRLGPSVRVVVSCIEETPTDSENPPRGIQSEETQSAGSLNLREKLNSEKTPAEKVFTTLDSRHPQPKHIPLGPLTADDVRIIVTSYLKEYCKELDAPYVDAICDETKLPQARNPLYLLVMLAELRTLGGNDLNQHVPALIADMGTQHPDTVSLFHWVLERLEKAEGFGEQPVRWWCLYLALGRVGMSSRELSDLLIRKLGPNSTATAQRIERALRRYLQRRGEQWDFFHGQLRKAVLERCIHNGKWPAQSPERNQEVSETIRQVHRDIAKYFSSLADPEGDKTWKSENQRAFNETAPHLIGAEQWDDLCAYLTDLLCLKRRFIVGQVYDVVKDHNAALAMLPEFREENARLARRDAAMIAYNKALREYAVPHGECRLATKQGLRALISQIYQWISLERGTPCSGPPELSDEDITGLPEEYSERAARLRHFSNFVNAWLNALASSPHDAIPLAFNFAEDSPVSMNAEGELAGRKEPWLLRSPRPTPPPLRPQCLRTLEGHAGQVNSVAVGPDGRLAVSGSSDKTLRVWDLEAGQCLRTLEGHAGQVNSVAVGPDGRLAVSGSSDKTLRVWDLEAGQCLRTLEGHAGQVNSVAVGPDGRLAVSGSSDKTLRVWDLEAGQCLRTLEGHAGQVNSVAVGPDGRLAVSGSSDKTLRVWDLETGQCVRTFKGHSSDGVSCVTIGPDGRRIVSAGAWPDKTLRVWDLKSGKCLHTLESYATGSTNVSMSLSPDGRRAVSGGRNLFTTFVGDYALRVWDLETGQRLCILEGHSGQVNGVAVSPDGRRTVSGSSDMTLRVWNLETRQSQRNSGGHEGEVRSVSVSPDGRRAVSGSSDRTLRVWDMEAGQCLRTLEGHAFEVNSVAVSPDGLRAVSGSLDTTLGFWSLETGKCLQIYGGHTSEVNSVVVSPDGRLAVSGSSDRTLRVWDLEAGQCLRTLEGHAGQVNSVAVSSDGRLAVSGSSDRTLRVWDLEAGQCLRPLEGHAGQVNSVAVGPDGRRAVSGSSDKTLRVWHMDTGQCLHILEGHADWVRSVSVSPDGRRAVSGSLDKTLRVWDLDTGQCLAVYHASSPIGSAVFTPSGDRIVCGTEDGQMHFLTLRNFPPLA